MAYALAASYAGEALLSGFSWFDGRDPSHGFVRYQSRRNAEAKGLYSVDEITGVVRLGVDRTNVLSLRGGRPSIRLEIWTYGPKWPFGGEVDIIEGANDQYRNVLSAHTAPGCTVSKTLRSMSAGSRRSTNCDVAADNVGCGYDAPANDTSSYGDAFNAARGGVYAMEWDAEYIKIWHFARGRIPGDIRRKRPDPNGWGLPDAIFGGRGCDVDRYFKDMRLVININFCGDWGNAIWGKTDGCGKYASTCSEFVARNPQAFANAYWDVRYIDAYQRRRGRKTPSSHAKPTTTTKSLRRATSTTTMTRSLATVALHGRKTTKVMKHGAELVSTPTPASPNVSSSSSFSDLPSATSGAQDPLHIDGAALLGCYGSSNGFQSFRKVAESRAMTVERCVKLCSGAKFAGAYDTQCFCAEALDANTRAVDAEFGECDVPCPGDRRQYCGGLARKVGGLANTTALAPLTGTTAEKLANTTVELTNNTTAAFKPQPYRNSSSSAAGIAPSGFTKHPATATATHNSTRFSRWTQKRAFHWKRKTLGQRDARPRNMLLTVYGPLRNKANSKLQHPPSPPPPPMAQGQNVTYTLTQSMGSLAFASAPTAPQEQVTETVVLVPVSSSSGSELVMGSRPCPDRLSAGGGAAERTGGVQTVRATGVVVVVEECGCEGEGEGEGETGAVDIAPLETTAWGQDPGENENVAAGPASSSRPTQDALSWPVSSPNEIAAAQPASPPPAQNAAPQPAAQPAQNAPPPSGAEASDVPSVSVMTAGAEGTWSGPRASIALSIAALLIMLML
ncbi:hypothetical protein E4U41_003185 [Claviceps citrina]|nr:hypothetical protein E4U41_003185 [Claviceps citrina]